MSGYAVVWSEQAGAVSSGRLELQSDRIVLDGTVAREVRFRDIHEVRVGRARGERLGGKPTLLVQLVSGGLVAIASVAGPGTLSELAERLLPLTGT